MMMMLLVVTPVQWIEGEKTPGRRPKPSRWGRMAAGDGRMEEPAEVDCCGGRGRDGVAVEMLDGVCGLGGVL